MFKHTDVHGNRGHDDALELFALSACLPGHWPISIDYTNMSDKSLQGARALSYSIQCFNFNSVINNFEETEYIGGV